VTPRSDWLNVLARIRERVGDDRDRGKVRER
jgi:hypothetical protein